MCIYWSLTYFLLLFDFGDVINATEKVRNNSLSIIINFHNESNIALFTTLESLVKETPASILREIILINDFDNSYEFKNLMISPKIKYYKNSKRMGLMRCRNKGFKLSRGYFVAFLDSHVKVKKNWSHYLINYLIRPELFPNANESALTSESQLRFAVPVIDSMNDFEYNETSPDYIGTMHSNFTFKWTLIEERLKNADLNKPRPMPIMPGGIFMTKRSTLQHIGLFDYKMEIWGAENIELSLRIWQCGGRIDLIPKSHVGHRFNEFHPYDFPKGKTNTILRNIKRTALVWLTYNLENSKFLSNLYSRLPQLMQVKPGPLGERLLLAKRLSCRNFTWYLNEINMPLKSSFSQWPMKASHKISAANDFKSANQIINL